MSNGRASPGPEALMSFPAKRGGQVGTVEIHPGGVRWTPTGSVGATAGSVNCGDVVKFQVSPGSSVKAILRFTLLGGGDERFQVNSSYGPVQIQSS